MAVETQSKMNGFLGAFPDIQSRHNAAVQLADPNEPNLPNEAYPSWDFMAAHWGDSDEELRALGDFAWNLYNDLPAGGPVAVFKKGTLEDLLAPEPYLCDDIELTCGIVSERELIYGYAGYLTQRGPSRMGIRPPYVAFGLRLRLGNVLEISAGMLGDHNVTRVDVEYADIPVYFGTVTLSEDPEVSYQSNRHIVQRDILIDRNDLGKASEAITEKTRSTSVPSLAA